MTTLSYAQNHEDVLLDRAFPRGRAGFYVDVGAIDPIVNSRTKHFYDLGWHGINVEPAGATFQALEAARPRDLTLNVGLSDGAGSPGANGQPTAEHPVATMSLGELCEQYVTEPIDFLSIDAGGHEQAVLAGNDWTQWRPRVVLVSATEPATRIPTHTRWEHLLIEAGYLFAAFDGINRYYVRPEDADLVGVLAVPVNVTDDYLPYAVSMLIDGLKGTSDEAARQLAASRVANATLREETLGLAAEVRALRDAYQQVERALVETRETCDVLGQASEDLRTLAGRLSAELAEVREAALRGGVLGAGAGAIRVAQKLTAISSRHPAVASSAKKIIRLGVQAKRSVAGGGSGTH
jgi:FkbM family methyltransferase